MTAIEAIRDDLLAECADDYVGIWSVLWEVRSRVGTADPVALQRLTLELIRNLLDSQAVQAGTFSPDGKRFVAWALTPDQAVDEIRKQWSALGRNPNIGEIAYLTTAGAARTPAHQP